MLHRRTSADTAPVGAGVQRSLTMVRRAVDTAPATETVLMRVRPFGEMFDALLFDLARILGASSVISCRAPPGALR